VAVLFALLQTQMLINDNERMKQVRWIDRTHPRSVKQQALNV